MPPLYLDEGLDHPEGGGGLHLKGGVPVLARGDGAGTEANGDLQLGGAGGAAPLLLLHLLGGGGGHLGL